jgi:beta-mannosidase
MQTIGLNGTWTVRSGEMAQIGAEGLASLLASEGEWLPAEVPGEIHLDLMRAGRMPDPSVSANMPDCRWPETLAWWFRTRVSVDAGLLEHEQIRLIFDGLDLYAQVFVNGTLAGEAANAFVPAVFDVKPLLREGDNELIVRLTAGSELAPDDTVPGQGNPERRPSAAEGGRIPNPMRDDDLYAHRIWAGRKWLRKPQFEYGWDWVDALPNIGIWRGVRIEARSHAVLRDIRVDTVSIADPAVLEIEAVVRNLHPWAERRCEVEIEIRSPEGRLAARKSYPLSAPPGCEIVRDTIAVERPELWWPNGLGEQPLYTVEARVAGPDGRICDMRRFAIGLRTVSIDRSSVGDRSRFCIRVNDEEVFCRGGNLGPHDAILARVSDAKYEGLVSEARRANMTMFRINGCSVFEGPAFYDACDRAGILIWQDFMFTCTTYPEQDGHLISAAKAECEAAVAMLRHHPSIALWSGNNECTWGFDDWWNPDKTKPLELGGKLLYNELMPDLCRRLDPRRPYWPSSPAGGEKPNSEEHGDCHWWHPFFMHPDVQRRIRHETFDECRSGFVSEYGAIGPCHLDSIREYLAEDEMNPESRAWRMHTNTFETKTVPEAIRFHYADPEALSVPEYVLYGQVFQAFVHGHAMEALRFRKHDPEADCAGALIWAYSDCWGETGWSLLDYYLRRKASWYWVRRACRPLKAIVRRRGEALVTRLVNDTRRAWSGTVETGWWRVDGKARETERRPVASPANSMVEIGPAPIPPASERDPREWLFAAVLRDDGGAIEDQCIWLLAPHRELALAEPDIQLRNLDGEYELASPVYCHAVHVEDHGRELLSDNWIDLLPGIPLRIRRTDGGGLSVADLSALGPR